MIAIVVSRADSASEHVGEHLLDLAEWDRRVDDSRPPADGGGEYHVTGGFELRTFEELHLHLNGVAAAFGADPAADGDAAGDPDLLVFASRHSGETGPLLTAHFTGNFGTAEFGGEAGELAEACPNALSRVVAALEDHAPEGYDVGTECTHHGPSDVGCPSMFVEVGSAEPQWADPEAARAVARAVLALRGVDAHRDRQVVGFGGGHYAPRFGRILRETPWAVGHVAADWALADLGEFDDPETRAVLRRAFERSKTDRALIDGDYPGLAAAVEDEGFEVVDETWVREVGDRPLALVEAVEEALGEVGAGVRFGDADLAGDADGDALAVVDLPERLLREAQGVDPGATRRAVAAHAVAFRTREGGSRATDRAAVPDDDGYEALVDDLAAVLGRKYESVAREGGAVVATERAFDPELAREAGVPEGPAFGKLSGGESVEVDGDTVTPGEVHRDRTRRFPV